GGDLVDVDRAERLRVGVGDAVLAGVVLCSGPQDGVGGERGFGDLALREVVTREAGAELVDRTEGPATEPPGHDMAPPSFLSCAYPIPLRIAIRFAIGGRVARA